MLLNLEREDGPLHRRIYDSMKSAIRAGRLKPGARLPSTRTLATDLAVSRNTVTLAYDQLIAEGYVISRRRSMMAVADTTPAPAQAADQPPPTSLPPLSAYSRRLAKCAGIPPSSAYGSRPGIRYDFR